MERLLVMAVVMTIASFSVSSMVRTIWMKERSSDWYDNIVLGTFTHREWIENFRMTQETFLYVCNERRPYIENRILNYVKQSQLKKGWQLLFGA